MITGQQPSRQIAHAHSSHAFFGRWQEILAESAPPTSLPVTTALWRAHRSIACAAQKDFVGAEREREEFLKAKSAIPADSPLGRDMARRVLDVSEFFVSGEIAMQKGNWDGGTEFLEQAASVEDQLSYGEPPQWLQPTRHTLGAVRSLRPKRVSNKWM